MLMDYLAHHWIELAGYAASVFVALGFFMKTIIPLRFYAIVSNILFIIYGFFSGLLPVLFLHLFLFPLNVLRLVQMLNLTRKIQAAAADREPELTALIPYMKKVRLQQDQTLFALGDEADAMYYIEDGRVHLSEIGQEVGAHQVIGEMGIFSPFRQRTASAVCLTDVTAYKIDEPMIKQLCYQNPAFGFYLMKLLTRRFILNNG